MKKIILMVVLFVLSTPALEAQKGPWIVKIVEGVTRALTNPSTVRPTGNGDIPYVGPGVSPVRPIIQPVPKLDSSRVIRPIVLPTPSTYSPALPNYQGLLLTEKYNMLDRFLKYVLIESQSIDDPDPNSFPMTEGQRTIAQQIYDEIRSFGGGVEVKMSEDYYVYAKVPSNMKKKVPSVMFMAHLDVTPEANGKGIKPQVHRNYRGGPIALGNGLVLSPDSKQGRHLKDLVGKTIVTSDGNTLLGADCKTGCAILVTLIEQMVNEGKRFEHGDVYFCFSQNEDVGKAAMRMDMNMFDKVPDMLFDIDGDEYGTFSVANFTAEGGSYLFKGNLAHPSNGKKDGYADARTAMAYFLGQLPPEVHPSHSEGQQGYIHCYAIDQLPNQQDVRLRFRVRYFDKEDGARYARYLDNALGKTREAFPLVAIEKEAFGRQYDNIAYSMHPKSVEVVSVAAQKTGIEMKPVEIRAGTTAAMMVAHGMPGGPCLYSGQNAAHSVYEWCCIEELVELTGLCKEIVSQIANQK